MATGGTSGAYSGFDRFGRMTDQKWSTFGGIVRDQFQYAYDRNSNRTSRDNTLATNLDELYGHDNLNRLNNMDRGTLSGGSIASPVKEEDWTLDATGNWSGFVTKASGTTDLNQSRSHNKVNEITGISETVGSAWIDPVQDAGGNLTTLPKPSSPTSSFTATYDAWNRLVELKEGISTVARYKYDARGRRTIKETYASGVLSETRHFYYTNAWQIIEERIGTSANPDRQFIWGKRYVDELVLRDRDANANGSLEERFYALQDANFNVTGLVDTGGNIVERYSYDAYGQPAVMDGSFGSRSSSSYDWETLYAGYRWDKESRLYQVRNRMYHSLLGRWLQRDPLGYVDGMNLYKYVGSNPLVRLDPYGLDDWSHQDQMDLEDWYYGNGPIFGPPQEARPPSGRPNPPANGCGGSGSFTWPSGPGSSQFWPTWDFTPACNAHDRCYGTCGSDKATCDNRFAQEMYRICDRITSRAGGDFLGLDYAARSACRAHAEATYRGVQIGGQSFFDAAQDEACEDDSCP